MKQEERKAAIMQFEADSSLATRSHAVGEDRYAL